mgnify:CR=1 FL=1
MWYNKNIETTERLTSMKKAKGITCVLVSVMAVSMFSGCSNENPLDGAVIGENSFIMTLYPDIAPITCENFQKLVDEGFYNGLTFHRVVDDFVVQGGDPNGDGTGSSSESIKGEFSENGVANNLSHVRSTVSMARADDFDSATCQFFICLSDLTYLDGSYAAFANVTEGMEVIDNFLNVPRSVGRMGELSSPDTPIYIKYSGTIEADSAGNPRIQFLIDIDSSASSSKSTSTANIETALSSTTETTVSTEANSETSTSNDEDIVYSSENIDEISPENEKSTESITDANTVG